VPLVAACTRLLERICPVLRPSLNPPEVTAEKPSEDRRLELRGRGATRRFVAQPVAQRARARGATTLQDRPEKQFRGLSAKSRGTCADTFRAELIALFRCW
jgi:hypothetical protein